MTYKHREKISHYFGMKCCSRLADITDVLHVILGCLDKQVIFGGDKQCSNILFYSYEQYLYMEPQNSVNEISDNQMHHTCWDFKFRIEKWLVEKWVVPRGSCCVSLNICKKTNWQCKHAHYLLYTNSSDLPCLWPRWMPLIISSAGFEGGICSWCAPPRCSVTTCPVCVNNPA